MNKKSFLSIISCKKTDIWCSMLTGSNVALNDPYALASSGGTKTVDEMDKIARQAVKDKLDTLISCKPLA